MKVSKEEVFHIADLARLSLTESESLEYQGHLEKILEHFDELKSVTTDSVERFLNPIRETQDFYAQARIKHTDEIRDSLEQKLILQNAPNHQYGQFKLDAVVKSD